MKPKLFGWRVITCLAMATGLAAIAQVSQGAIYPIDFDPEFDGIVLVDLPNDSSCRANPTGTVNVDTNLECTLNLVSADVFPVPAGSPHYVDSFLTNYFDIADAVYIDNGSFTQLQTRALNILLREVGGCATTDGYCGALMAFQIGGGANNDNPNFPGLATLTPGFISGSWDGKFFYVNGFTPTGDTLQSDYRVPEPSTLSLLLGAFALGWTLMRRKIIAT